MARSFAVGVFVAGALVGCRQAPAREPPQVLVGTYIVGARLPVRAERGGRILGTTTCSGPNAILAREAAATRVRAFRPDGTFVAEGIVDDADLARLVADPKEREACDGGVVVVRSEALPEDAALALVPPLLTKVDRSATWSGEGDVFRGADCARSRGEGALLEESDTSPEGRIDRTWGLSLDDGNREVRLTGPTEVRTKAGERGTSESYLCLRTFRIVGKRGDSLVVLRGGARLTGSLPVAYDPRDAELWYTSNETCLRDHPTPPPSIAAARVLRHGCS